MMADLICHSPIWVFSKNSGGFPPKWMVKIMENPIKMDDLGGFPIIFGNTHILTWLAGNQTIVFKW